VADRVRRRSLQSEEVLRCGVKKESKVPNLAGFSAGAGGSAMKLALAATEHLGLQFGRSIRKLGQNRG